MDQAASRMKLRRNAVAAGILLLAGLTVFVWPLMTVRAQLNIFSTPAPSEEPSPEASPSATPTPESTPIPLAAAVQASENVEERIEEIKRTVLSEPTVREIRKKLADQNETVNGAEIDARRQLSGVPSLDSITDLQNEWGKYLSQVSSWQIALQSFSKRLDDADRELTRELKAWKELKQSIDAPRTAVSKPPASAPRQETEQTPSPAPTAEQPSLNVREVPAAIRDRINQTISDIEKVLADIADVRTEILEIQPSLGRREKRIRGIIQLAEDEKDSAISNLFSRDSPPIWAAESLAAQTPGEFSETIGGQLVETREYLAARVVNLAVLGVFGLLVILGLYRAKRRTRDLVAEEPELKRALVFFRMPVISGLLITLFMSGIALPSMPELLEMFATLLLLLPGYLILRTVVQKPLIPILNALLLFYVFDEILTVFDAYPFVYRLMLAAEMLIAIVLAVWLSRRRSADVSFISDHAGMVRKMRIIVLLCTVPFLISFAASILGFVNLARLLSRGVLDSAYAALFFYAFYLVLVSLTVFAIRVRPLSRLRMLETHRALVLSKYSKFLKWLLVSLWVLTALNYLYLLRFVAETLGEILRFDLTLGSFSISLADILLFGFLVWLAFALSRLVRFVLEEDVYTRVKLKEGVPYAVSTVLHYLLLLGGFTLAVLSLGLDLTKFTILAGAFGVGLGFGLQNIVQNFVSGIILLFERPVKVGDIIERGQETGELRRIGLRASVVGTPEGAEIIVPNAALISEEVTNWTPAENLRRLELNLGVAYGSDPEEVMEVIKDAAKEHPEIAQEPEPLALFTGLGDSSLNFQLRIWADNESTWWITRSDIYVSIYKALTEAGIEMPFPQRDLHVRSFSSDTPVEVLKLLKQKEGKGKDEETE